MQRNRIAISLFNFRFIKEHRDVLQSLLAFDSKLLSVIPYICPQGDLCHLCEIVPLHIAIVCIPERMGLNNRTLKLASYNEKKVCLSILIVILFGNNSTIHF